MKKLLLTALAIASLMTAKSQVIFLEDFDGVPGPTAGGAGTYNFPTGWSIANVDNGTPAASVNWVNEGWERREDFAGDVNDSVAFSTSWTTPASTSNDWMTTPAIGPLPANTVLTWNAVTYDPSYPDGYEVRIMTVAPTGGTGVIGNLITASTQIFTIAAENTTWTPRSVSLSAYAGQTVYISYHNNSNDKFLLAIDDVKLEAFSSPTTDANLVSLDTMPEYTMIPASQVYNMPTLATVNNAGTGALTNVTLTMNVYDGGFGQIYTNTSAPLATLASGGSAQLSAGSYMLPTTPDVYYFEFIVGHAATDTDPSNDTIYNYVVITDSTYARDDGNVTGGLGIGAGDGGHLGQQFNIMNAADLTSATFYVTAGYTGEPAACVIWNMVGGVPSSIIASTDTLMYPDDSARVYTLPISGGPLSLSPGMYTITFVEFDSTMQLGQTAGIFTVGAHWVNWPSSPLGGWGHPEAFGASFARASVLRMNLNPACALSANAVATDATCGTCADGSATVSVTGGTAPTYAWAPTGGTGATATGLLPGTYTVTITDGACMTTATTTVNFTTSIDEATVAANTTVYPNPAKDVVTVSIPEGFGSETQVIVTNYLGQTVYTAAFNTFGNKELNLSELASGKYTVRFTSEKYTVNKNFTIAK